MSDDLTSSDPRCLAVLAKLAKARDRMKRLGIPTLLDGHKGWQKVNPMSAPTAPAKVIDMKRRRK